LEWPAFFLALAEKASNRESGGGSLLTWVTIERGCWPALRTTPANSSVIARTHGVDTPTPVRDCYLMVEVDSDDIKDKLRFLQDQWLRSFMKLGHGILSHDTFGRVFGMIAPDQFESAFRRWQCSQLNATPLLTCATPGKVHTVKSLINRQHELKHLILNRCWMNFPSSSSTPPP